MPILANDVQAAPMYPLTLALIWVPDEYFWNVFVLARWIIFASGAYLLASQCFRFNLVGSSIFVLVFVFALYHARFINHAFLNGMAAGVWYLYFTLALLNTDKYQNYFRHLIGLVWGLIIAAYSVVTCGFPEASVTVALATILIWPFAFYRFLEMGSRLTMRILGLTFIANLLGIAIASPQLLALVEMMILSSSEFRSSHALSQYGVSLYDFLLGKITLFGPRPPDPNIHVFGLVPVFLFCFGLISACTPKKQTTWGHGALLACGVFFLLKNFPIFGNYFPPIETLHRSISSIPVISQTWLTLYSFPLLLLFFAFFAGKGAHTLTSCTRNTNKVSLTAPLVFITTSTIVVLMLLHLSSFHLTGKSYLENLRADAVTRQIGIVFTIFCLMLFSISLTTHRLANTIAGFVIVGLALLEYNFILPDNFMNRKAYSIQHERSDIGKNVDDVMDEHGLGKNNIRFADYGSQHFGFFIGHGYSTFRNGAVAMYTSRQTDFRKTVLGADWGGFFPILDVPNNNGWAMSSAGIHFSTDSIDPRIQKKILDTGRTDGLGDIRLTQHKNLMSDRVGCKSSAVGPDNQMDNVFSVEFDLWDYRNYQSITQIELIRNKPSRVIDTSGKNHVLGVSRALDTPLINGDSVHIDIPIDRDRMTIWLFACNDGHDHDDSQYSIRTTLHKITDLRTLGSTRSASLQDLRIPTELFSSGLIDGYIDAVLKLAAKGGGDPKGIEKHTIDIETAVRNSPSLNIAIAHTLNFLKGVGAEIIVNAHTQPNHMLFIDPMALPRAYIPMNCIRSKNQIDSLRKIISNQFKIGQAVIEFPPEYSSEVCKKHRAKIQAVNIESDQGRHISLEPVMGPNILVLNDNYYPGWKAVDTVSHDEIEIYPVNLTFRAMILPEERQYKIELRYWPPWLSAACAISLTTLASLILLTILARRKF